MDQIAMINGVIIWSSGFIGLYPSCCCALSDYCISGYYVNGPTITWQWDTAWGGWVHVPPETQETANQKCQDFYDANGLLGGGVVAPLFGAFDGEQVNFASCACGS